MQDDPIDIIISERGLYPVMDCDGWQRFLETIAGLPFPPPYTLKLLTDSKADRIEEDVSYWGDYSVLAEGFRDVEWVCVRPSYLRHRGRLIAPERLDCTAELRTALTSARIPFEESNGSFFIFGYRPIAAPPAS